jgi:hypothetical protein
MERKALSGGLRRAESHRRNAKNTTRGAELRLSSNTQYVYPPLDHIVMLRLKHYAASQPPSLLVTVSGTVVHGDGLEPNPKPREQEGQPRVFSQSFMLVPDTSAAPVKDGEVGKYYISSDAMRFVG